MATCESCGKEIKDGDWNCGYCGAPVAKTSATATGAAAYAPPADAYAPSADAYAPAPYPSAGGYQPASAAVAVPSRGMSRGLVVALVVAAVAVLAIVAVWFFFVRGGGSPFDGTWNAGSTAGAAQIVITGSGDGMKIEFTGTDASGQTKKSTVPAHMDGADLVVTVDDFIKATGNKDQATQLKAAFEAIIKDFRLVFALQDSTHLKMTVEGTLASGAQPAAGQRSTVLTKAD